MPNILIAVIAVGIVVICRILANMFDAKEKAGKVIVTCGNDDIKVTIEGKPGKDLDEVYDYIRLLFINPELIKKRKEIEKL